MKNYRRIAELKRKEVSNRCIAKQLSLSRNTVNMAVGKMLSSGYAFEEFESASDKQLKNMIGKVRQESDYEQPDFIYLSKELAKPGVTLQLLWEEYYDECRLSKKQGYQITQFKKLFHEHLNKNEFTDIITHKAGERTEVDWAGTRPRWQDPDTGEIILGWLFVGVLAFSGYGYAEAFANMKMANWIKAHIHMFKYFCGVSKTLVPDNLKTGVTKNGKEELILNKTYKEMADHYGTVIIPARVKHPKDKPSAEGLVNQLTTQIIGRMRNYQFFTIEEYNRQLLIELERFNNKPFQKKEGSRSILFEELEKGCLIPLPCNPYVICEWKKAKVSSNSHISLGKCYYSVPHEYIGKIVDLKIYDKELIIYHNQAKICRHSLVKDQIGIYVTQSEHMPIGSNAYGDWNSNRYLNWAKQKGPFVYQVVQRQFESVKIEQQAYRTVHKIIKLADSYGNTRLNAACQYGLEYYECPSYKDIMMILVNKQDNLATEKQPAEKAKYLRGAEYYE